MTSTNAMAAKRLDAPTVSVLMPVYNGERFLAEAVDSILQQSWTDFEFIIVDDGSSDRTPEMLRAVAARDDRMVVVRAEANEGLTRALNRGLAVARGRYVARQDADDRSAPERLAQQVSFLESRPEVGVLGTAFTVVDKAGRVVRTRYFDGLLTDEALQRELLVFYCICHATVMMRREVLARVGGYDPKMEPAEDHDLWLRLGEITKLAVLPEPFYQYRMLDTSVSHQRRSEQVLRVAQAIENAIRRRNGPDTLPASLKTAAQPYVRAMIAAVAAGDLDGARERIGRAMSLDPQVLVADEPLAGRLQDHSTPLPAREALALYDTVFGRVLPQTRRLARLRRTLIGNLHMREVFAGSHQRDRGRIRAHLWRGLRANPAWLLNRGVLAIAGRTLLGRSAPARR